MCIIYFFGHLFISFPDNVQVTEHYHNKVIDNNICDFFSTWLLMFEHWNAQTNQKVIIALINYTDPDLSFGGNRWSGLLIVL